MRVGFPHMGNFYIPFEALLKALGLSPVVPPRPTKRSIERGVKHSPELACFPLKATLGDLISALEGGADTLIWFEGAWSCRFGYYGRTHHQILRDMGYEFDGLLFDGGELVRAIRGVRRVVRSPLPTMVKAGRFCWHKSRLVKLVELLSRKVRPYELTPKATTRVAEEALRLIRRAQTVSELKALEPKIVSMFDSIPKDEGRRPLRIWLVGEVYMVLEPEANFHLVEYLGEEGVEVTPFTTIHNWMFRAFGSGRRGVDGEGAARRVALPYLPYPLGGEEELSIGYTILAKRRGYDGVIHLRPFTCMTENVAHPIIHNLSREYQIPVLSLSLDEHTESVGFFTRLDAFLELLRRRGRGYPLRCS